MSQLLHMQTFVNLSGLCSSLLTLLDHEAGHRIPELGSVMHAIRISHRLAPSLQVLHEADDPTLSVAHVLLRLLSIESEKALGLIMLPWQ